jgi:hypothetical protein
MSQEIQKSQIILFYEGLAPDHKGRYLRDILELSNEQFDECHDFIQWLFPLHEKSRMTNAPVPVITQEDYWYFKNSSMCKENMTKSLGRFVQFLNEFGNENWCNNNDHNLLRITRIIRSLRLFGLEGLASNFYDSMIRVAVARGISPITCHYWKRALIEGKFETLY